MLVTPEHVPPDCLVAAATLGVVGLKKFVEMERFHAERVMGLTFILWVACFYLFCLAFPVHDTG